MPHEHEHEATSKNSPRVPKTFDHRYMINFSVIPDNSGAQTHTSTSKTTAYYTHPAMQEFRRILQLYLDFRAKKTIEQVKKIVEGRASLPIAAFKDKIIEAVNNNSVVLVAGDTGCGKSTQVAQYLLERGYTNIACTQPRRISAMSLCRRVAYETLNEFGSEIAYSIRFETSKTKHTRILFMTEGVLLRQLISDPTLAAYDVVIVDEVHERHVTCDFLLGLLKCVLAVRSNLKIILMSATINAELFSSFFGGAPMVRVPGRMYPVSVQYKPTKADTSRGLEQLRAVRDTEGGADASVSNNLSKQRMELRRSRDSFDPQPYVRILQQIDSSYGPEERGDLLVFLSGMQEMQAVASAAQGYVDSTKRWILLLLHSSLSIDEQDKVFGASPAGIRKCILSTNIAETSVTIDGVRFVVDSGKAKELLWDPNTSTKSLQEFWISKASAEQRKGRAGRTGPGKCFRLYAETTYDNMVPFAEPEIVRTPLETVMLQIKAMGMVDPRQFPFITPPPLEHSLSALASLALLGATDVSEVTFDLPVQDAVSTAPLTLLGRLLSTTPVEPNVGKMLALGAAFQLVHKVATLASVLTVQTPFENPSKPQDETAEQYSRRHTFDSPDGDPFTVANAFSAWIERRGRRHTKDGEGSSKKWCRKYFLHEQRLYELAKLKQQLWGILRDSGLLGSQNAALDDLLSTQTHGPDTAKISRHMIRQMKAQEERKRKKRILTLNDSVASMANGDGDEDDGDAENEQDDDDVRSLQYMATARASELEDSVFGELTGRQMWCVKIALTAGLYPQLAVADGANAHRPMVEQQYVTLSRDGLYLHPSSVISHVHDVQGPKIATSQGDARDLYVYSSLLETHKPFLCNVFTMPALQTSLLFARRIFTDHTLTKLLVDDWILFELDGLDLMLQLLTIACTLRIRLEARLQVTLEMARRGNTDGLGADTPVLGQGLSVSAAETVAQRDNSAETTEQQPVSADIQDVANRIARAIHTVKQDEDDSFMQLSRDLSDFMVTNIRYKMKKVSPSQAEDLLQDPNVSEAPALTVRTNTGSNVYVGLLAQAPHALRGVQVTPFLRLGSLVNSFDETRNTGYTCIRIRWMCPTCNISLMATQAEIDNHAMTHKPAGSGTVPPETHTDSQPKKRPRLGTSVKGSNTK